MCGIAGVISTSPRSASQLTRMSHLLEHRGPDDHGLLQWPVDGGVARGREPRSGQQLVGLAHRRLAVIELTDAGWQPMSTADDRFHLVFNGEVYNYLELRAELEREGARFRSASDTEVVLEAYARWGASCLPRFVGMFALAVLDTARGTLFCARDPFGIKPFYYSTWEGSFAFASEPKALLSLPEVSPRVDPGPLQDYLRFGVSDHGDRTLFASVRQLPPAHHATIQVDRPHLVATTRYWTPPRRRDLEVSFSEAAAEVRRVLLDSVRLHLRSDVPLGAALSGGIDSSAIVAAAAATSAPGTALHAFGYVADDPALDESHWMRIAAEASGASLTTTTPGPMDLVGRVDELIRTQDEPFGSTSIFVQHEVFHLARSSGITVLLDGQGADELLAGYPQYLASRVATLLRQGRLGQAWSLARAGAAKPGAEPFRRLLLRAVAAAAPPGVVAAGRRVLGEELRPTWLDAGWFEERGQRVVQPVGRAYRLPLSAALREELSASNLPALLRYEDRNSMAVSLETRVPFLTCELVELVMRLPERHLISPDGTSKAVLREAVRGLVPDAVLDRRDKIGFATPERQWLARLGPWVGDVLHGDGARAVRGIDMALARQQATRVLAGDAPYQQHLWRWLNLVRWTELYDVTYD